MSDRNEMRRRWIVHPRYQLRFALGLVALNLTVGFLYQVTLHYRVRELARRSGSLEDFLQTDPWVSIWPALVVATAFSALVVFYIGIRYSHQIVGPLPRINRAIAALARGEDPPRLSVRSGDVLGDLVGGINRLAETLHDDPAGQQSERNRTDQDDMRVDPDSILGPRDERARLER